MTRLFVEDQVNHAVVARSHFAEALSELANASMWNEVLVGNEECNSRLHPDPLEVERLKARY
ncbi:hypothetical protein KRZ98_04285 [Sphingobium sp. AS12]|uniref:hypothetical protein n=1 Tax=Sphingobium sp. AS12 TaxID=2849495 RepID=UPI001C31989F|nr:hypothetical protein [Sphingobium sp. AS12]MBV2147504.1 hypothetical protein [Sphingobium sp. AS12]